MATIQWVATGYLLALVDGDPAHRLGDGALRDADAVVRLARAVPRRLGAQRRRVVGRLLIAFRVVQGIGGGIILPVGQTMLARAAGPQRMDAS